MAALQLKDLLERLDRGTQRDTSSPEAAQRATRHAAEVWASCRLDGEAPDTIEYCTRAGADLLCHFNAGRKDCYLIVLCPVEASRPMDHLLFDIGADYRPAEYEDLSTGFVGEPTAAILAESLPRLGEGGTPAAILGRGGSYLQTSLDAPGRYLLEYQLVTTAFHFNTKITVTLDDVQRAFHSYAFGKYEWAREFDWQHQPL